MRWVTLRVHQRKFDLAGVHSGRAVGLNPNDVMIAGHRANWLVRVGRLDEALQSLDAAMRRDPYPPTWHLGHPLVCALPS